MLVDFGFLGLWMCDFYVHVINSVGVTSLVAVLTYYIIHFNEWLSSAPVNECLEWSYGTKERVFERRYARYIKNTVGEDMWMGSICYYLSVWCSVGDMLHQKHISACRNADNDYISKIIGSQLTWFCRLCGFLLVIQFGPPITVHMIIYLQGVFWLLVKPLHYPIYSLWGPRRGKYGYYSRHCSYHLILRPKQGSLCAGKSM